MYFCIEDEVRTLELKYPSQNITTHVQAEPHPGKETPFFLPFSLK